MAVVLKNVVPWGRSLQEYTAMFDLKASDLQLKILDCAAGPASFNAELHEVGTQVVSCSYKLRGSGEFILATGGWQW